MSSEEGNKHSQLEEVEEKEGEHNMNSDIIQEVKVLQQGKDPQL